MRVEPDLLAHPVRWFLHRLAVYAGVAVIAGTLALCAGAML